MRLGLSFCEGVCDKIDVKQSSIKMYVMSTVTLRWQSMLEVGLGYCRTVSWSLKH